MFALVYEIIYDTSLHPVYSLSNLFYLNRSGILERTVGANILGLPSPPLRESVCKDGISKVQVRAVQFDAVNYSALRAAKQIEAKKNPAH